MIAACSPDLLEVQCIYEGEELILGLVKLIIDQSIREENRVVSKLDLRNGLLNSNFKLLLGLNSISNTFPKLLKRRWINEQEVTLERLFVNLHCALHVDLDNWNLACVLDPLQL